MAPSSLNWDAKTGGRGKGGEHLVPWKVLRVKAKTTVTSNFKTNIRESGATTASSEGGDCQRRRESFAETCKWLSQCYPKQSFVIAAPITKRRGRD